jgi:hypothetical protein
VSALARIGFFLAGWLALGCGILTIRIGYLLILVWWRGAKL